MVKNWYIVKKRYEIFLICYTTFVILTAIMVDAPGEGYTLITQAKSSYMDWDIDSKGYASRYQFRNLWKKVDGVKEVQVFEDKRLLGDPLWYISAIEFEDYTWEVYGKADLDKEQLDYINDKIKQFGELRWKQIRNRSIFKIIIWIVLFLIYMKKIKNKA